MSCGIHLVLTQHVANAGERADPKCENRATRTTCEGEKAAWGSALRLRVRRVSESRVFDSKQKREAVRKIEGETSKAKLERDVEGYQRQKGIRTQAHPRTHVVAASALDQVTC